MKTSILHKQPGIHFLLCLPFLATVLGGRTDLCASTTGPSSWRLRPAVQVGSEGIFLHQVVDAEVPRDIRLGDAPPFGQMTGLSRARIAEAVRRENPDALPANWSGASQIRISRRSRPLHEAELKDLLTQVLQREHVGERGELELSFSRPWSAAPVPDEPLTLRILDLPTAGVTPNFILRFELRTRNELAGVWQVPLRARIWTDVWVARSPLQRGQSLAGADIATERRDILTLRDALTDLDPDDDVLEFAGNVRAGTPLTARSLRLRPVVQRGGLVEALFQDGTLLISVRAEALEEGVPGQTIRVRNIQSRREFRAKVENEQTVIVTL